mgnify:CR=1 FL=1
MTLMPLGGSLLCQDLVTYKYSGIFGSENAVPICQNRLVEVGPLGARPFPSTSATHLSGERSEDGNDPTLELNRRSL